MCKQHKVPKKGSSQHLYLHNLCNLRNLRISVGKIRYFREKSGSKNKTPFFYLHFFLLHNEGQNFVPK